LAIIKVYLKFIALFIHSPKNWPTQTFGNKKINVLAVYLSLNQKDSICSWFKTDDANRTASQSFEADIKIPWGRFAFLCLMKTHKVIKLLKNQEDSEAHFPWIEEYVRYEAGIVLAGELFNIVSPLAVLVSNDHNGVSRAIISVAKDRGIKTIYTQHGQIGGVFPRLTFDLSLLDGIQALNQYIKSGVPTGEVVITGRRSITQFIKNESNNSDCIGVATNNDDEIETWDGILKILAKRNSRVILRTHPADRRRTKWEKLAFKHQVEMDYGSLKNYLSRIKILISGLSGIALDAHLLGVRSILVYPNQKFRTGIMKDYYGYVKYQISKECLEINELERLIEETQSEESIFNNSIYYECGLIENPNHLKALTLSKYIESIIDNNSFSLGEEDSFDCGIIEDKSFFAPKTYLQKINL